MEEEEEGEQVEVAVKLEDEGGEDEVVEEEVDEKVEGGVKGEEEGMKMKSVEEDASTIGVGVQDIPLPWVEGGGEWNGHWVVVAVISE